MVEVQDVRGQDPAATSKDVLVDPSGRRARALKLVGWLIAVAFVAWFLGLAVAGLDVIPSQRPLLGPSLIGQRSMALRGSPSTHTHASVKSR